MKANRNLEKLPPYLFVEIDKKKKQLLDSGVELIDFGIGDPDLPPPPEAYELLGYYAQKERDAHRYPSNQGDIRFRKSVADFYRKRFGISLNVEGEILSLIGSKEGLAHIILAYVNPGDYVLVPDPAYPVYQNMTILVGGIPYKMPLREENGFFPDFSKIPEDILKKTKLMFLCYPNNPTGAMADKEKLAEAVKIAGEYDFLICYDNAYSEIYYQEPPSSILEVEGAMEVAVEFNSFSKMFNLTGWRIAFALGKESNLFPLLKIKQNADSGTYLPIQLAAADLLSKHYNFVEKMRKIYKKRLQLLVKGLVEAKFEVTMPQATFYIWKKVPQGKTSIEWSQFLLEKIGIVSAPGIGFGEYGEGYIRFSVTLPDKDIERAVEKLSEFSDTD